MECRTPDNKVLDNKVPLSKLLHNLALKSKDSERALQELRERFRKGDFGGARLGLAATRLRPLRVKEERSRDCLAQRKLRRIDGSGPLC